MYNGPFCLSFPLPAAGASVYEFRLISSNIEVFILNLIDAIDSNSGFLAA